jgi:hypothetical protein
MHKYYRLFFSVLLFLVACSRVKTPAGIIQEEKMAALLIEVHIIDGSMYSVQQMPDSLYKYGMGKYLAIFKRFDTDSVQFRKSFKYYSSHPDRLEIIYNKVSADLKLKTDSLNKISRQIMDRDNKRRADSLKKLPKKPVVPPVITPNPQKHPVLKAPNSKKRIPFKVPN